jgi:hypothetical protein
MAAAGVGTGYGLGYAFEGLFLCTLIGTLAGVGIGLVLSGRMARKQGNLIVVRS